MLFRVLSVSTSSSESCSVCALRHCDGGEVSIYIGVGQSRCTAIKRVCLVFFLLFSCVFLFSLLINIIVE